MKRETKSKGEQERYTHLNAEFQKIARKDMKAFLSDQCKKIEKNNRMGKTSDFFKEIRDTKGTFHAKTDTVKDKRYGTNRSRRYKERDGKDTQNNYTKKIFMNQIIAIV